VYVRSWTTRLPRRRFRLATLIDRSPWADGVPPDALPLARTYDGPAPSQVPETPPHRPFAEPCERTRPGKRRPVCSSNALSSLTYEPPINQTLWPSALDACDRVRLALVRSPPSFASHLRSG